MKLNILVVSALSVFNRHIMILSEDKMTMLHDAINKQVYTYELLI